MEIKLITMLVLTIFFGSCKNQKFICSEIKSAKINPVVLYDASFVFNRCRARCFDPNKWETLPIKSCPKLVVPEEESLVESDFEEMKKLGLEGSPEAINLDIEECEGVAGFKIDDMGREIRPKVKRLNTLKEDSCGE